MDGKYISPQVRIVTSIYFRGGSAKTDEIIKDTGLISHAIRGNVRHLISRSIVTKKVPIKKIGGWGMATYTIRPQKIEKVKQMIRDAYGEDYIKDER